ncbi:MAG: tetratricopeptide repeat protein [Bacteroidales bacterium]|nr:tetratricopeptide repeat protein [Bacteroidales bacterium]
MMNTEDILNEIRSLNDAERYEEALQKVDDILKQDATNDTAWYIKGNIFKKQEKWQDAINCYTQAISINPKNPATTMRRICIDILNFYDKTMYNP